MTILKSLLASGAALALTAGAALAEPAVIYDLGGKFDGSFNEAAYRGAEKYKAETGKDYRDIELSSEAQREQAVRRFAEAGYNPVITTGFQMSAPLAAVAPDYPDITFVTIDGYVDPAVASNVMNISFAEHQGSYLVGMMAAMASKSGTVGFVGGMDVPLIRKFACGYAQGVKAVNPDAKVISNMTGNTPTAWNDPVKGAELAKAQVGQGADVIFAAAGGTGFGVLQAAADEKILSIGVDSNQNPLHPGQVLTSMLKRVDVAVYEAMMKGEDLEGGFMALDLASDGVNYAMDDNNKDLVSADMQAKVEEAKAKIASGEIDVHNYETDETCPALTF